MGLRNPHRVRWRRTLARLLVPLVLWSGATTAALAQQDQPAPASDAAPSMVWRVQSFLPLETPVTDALQRFATRIEERSEGRLKMEVLPVGAVVPPTETLLALGDGRLEAHLSAPSYFATLDPAFAALGDSAATYQDKAQQRQWFFDGGGLDLARELYLSQGAFFVGPVYWPPEWLIANRPIDGAAELSGLKVRAPYGPVGNLFTAAGAEPTFVPAAEVMEAIESGRLDAADWAILAINHGAGLHETASHAVFIGHSMPITEFSVGLKAWNSLDDGLKVLVEEEVRTLSEEVRAELEAAEGTARNELQTLGTVLAEWPTEQRTELRGLMAKAWESERGNSELVARIVDSHEAFQSRLDLPMPEMSTMESPAMTQDGAGQEEMGGDQMTKEMPGAAMLGSQSGDDSGAMMKPEDSGKMDESGHNDTDAGSMASEPQGDTSSNDGQSN